MLEAAGARERFSDCREIVLVFIERRADGDDVAKRRKEFESPRQQTFSLKYLEQSPGAGTEHFLTHGWHHNCAGIDQRLCAVDAREVLFVGRVEAIAIGAGRDSQQSVLGPFNLATMPGKQCWILSQQLLQTFDIVVMNDVSRLGHCP